MKGSILASCVLAVPSASAQVRAGGEFKVNTFSVVSFQYTPAMAALPDGGFVVVWQSFSDNSMSGQRFDASGARLGAEFEVAPKSEFGKRPVMAADDRGRFVVAWENYVRVFARRFDASGVPLGGSFHLSDGTHQQREAAVAIQPGGGFVVVWMSDPLNGSVRRIFGRRFDGAGRAAGVEFQVNTVTTTDDVSPTIAADEDGRFVVVWTTFVPPNTLRVFGQRFQANGDRAGAEFEVSGSSGSQGEAHVLPAPAGEFVVTWHESNSLFARRFDASGSPQGPAVPLHPLDTFGPLAIAGSASAAGDYAIVWDSPLNDVAGRRFAVGETPRGAEFRANTTTGNATVPFPGVVADASGNLLVSWIHNQTSPFDVGVYAQRYGGLLPNGLTVADGGNRVLEVGDTFALVTSWRNVNGTNQTFQGRASAVATPPGLILSLSPEAHYGTVAHGAAGSCTTTCFSGTLAGTRPAGHLDASFLERILPDAQGQSRKRVLHVGGTFDDVPRTSAFYRFVETLLHHEVTSGCGAATYCPAAVTTREQMAAFVLVAKEGAGYVPPACGAPAFTDVAASSPFCRWIEELARRGVAGGCGAGRYCPADAVSREQMAVFVLRTLDPSLDPPACTTPAFDDVPADSPFCRWIEELARRGVVTGCAPGLYCPAAPVTREQMAVFLTQTFGLTLYGA